MSDTPQEPTLRRAVTLPRMVLDGLGVTIGAGIYVLIGETVAEADMFAPAAFLVAAVIMAFSAGSFCELSCRHPQSAVEAIYVEAGFALPALTFLTGVLIVVAAIVSATAIAVGGTGYIPTLLPLSDRAVLIAVILVLGASQSMADLGARGANLQAALCDARHRRAELSDRRSQVD